MQNGFTSDFSSFMITLSWLGYAVGAPMLGFLSDHLSRRRPVLIAAAFVVIGGFVGIVYFPFDQNSVMLYFFFFGVGGIGSNRGLCHHRR